LEKRKEYRTWTESNLIQEKVEGKRQCFSPSNAAKLRTTLPPVPPLLEIRRLVISSKGEKNTLSYREKREEKGGKGNYLLITRVPAYHMGPGDDLERGGGGKRGRFSI